MVAAIARFAEGIDRMRGRMPVLCLVLPLLTAACTVRQEDRYTSGVGPRVEIEVVDEAGKPVPGAEVWRVIHPPLRQSSSILSDEPVISFDYLDRVARRYKDVAEYAGPWRPGFEPALESVILSRFAFQDLPPTDARGRTQEKAGFEFKRPASADIRIAALHYGYFPGLVQMHVQQESAVQARIVLRRDPAIALPRTAYLEAFDRIRHEAANPSNEGRAESWRKELIAAAQSAERAGDRRNAARILAWVPFLPTATSISGHSNGTTVSGYVRENERSVRNIAILEQAHRLDPDNFYIRMKKTILAPARSRAERIEGLARLFDEAPESTWPGVFMDLEMAYLAGGQKDKAYQILLENKRIEPEAGYNTPRYFKLRMAVYVSVEQFERDYLRGGDPDKQDEFRREPVFYALHAGRTDLLDWLLAKGVRTPLPDYALREAIVSGNPELVRRILALPHSQSGIKPNRFKYDLETVAARRDIPWFAWFPWDEIDALIREADRATEPQGRAP